MYWEKVRASYSRSPGGAVIVATNVRKTVVEYGSKRLRYSLRCNCTPDVALNRVRRLPDVFRRKVGWEIFGNVRVSENHDTGLSLFSGPVRRGRVVIDVPLVMEKEDLFSGVRSELGFQEKYVDERAGVYSYYDGSETLHFDSFEALVSHVLGESGDDDVKELFGEEFFRLFPGSRTYFRDFGRRMTVYSTGNSDLILVGPGYEVVSLDGGVDGPEEVLEAVAGEVDGVPGELYVAGGRVLKGSYYRFEGGFYLEHDVKRGPVYSEDVFNAADGYGAVGGIIGRNNSVLVFDDFVLVVLGWLGVVQKVRFSRRPRRFGSMYRYLYFAPHVGVFEVRVDGDVGLAVFVAIEEVVV